MASKISVIRAEIKILNDVLSLQPGEDQQKLLNASLGRLRQVAPPSVDRKLDLDDNGVVVQYIYDGPLGSVIINLVFKDGALFTKNIVCDLDDDDDSGE